MSFSNFQFVLLFIHLQQHYSLHETVGLAVGAVFKTDAVLTFEKTLLQVVSAIFK